MEVWKRVDLARYRSHLGELALFPDRLTALASAACNAGARDELHNLGAVHQAAHHAALTLDRYAPERLPESTWSEILTAHSRTN